MKLTEDEKLLSEDYDDDGELDVESYPIPKGLERAWDVLHENEALAKSLNAAIATGYTTGGDKSPGPGLGANYAIDTPLKKKPKRKQVEDEDDPTGVKRALKKPKARPERVITTDKDSYIGFRGVNAVHKYVIPEPVRREGLANEIERNREHTEKEIKRRQSPGNRVDIKREQKND
jgi:hypothetical protein